MKTDQGTHTDKSFQYDKDINIATASSRMAKKWKNQTITIQQFVERLSKTVRTPETVNEYKAMPKIEQDGIKDVGAFVGGTLKGGRRRKSDVANRHILTLDLDYATPKTIPIIKDVFSNICFSIYSTHKHTPQGPRLRLIIYPDRVMFPDEYQAIMRSVAAKIDIEVVDETSHDVNRLFYWPSTSDDGEFIFYHHDQPFLQIDETLNEYGEDENWKDVSLWPRSSRETKNLDRILKKQADPLSKKGLIGAFCRVVGIKEALNDHLKNVYRKENEDRYTYIDGSSSKGLVIYGNLVFSNHATDPACGICCNSFDLVRIHKFGHLDDKVKFDVPTTKLPSYKEMIEFAREIDGVKIDLIKSGFEIDASAFDDFDIFNIEEWEGKLQTDDKGKIKSTFLNAVLIVKNDPEVKEKMKFNEFSLEMERNNGENWNSVDSYKTRIYIGQKYQVDFPEAKIEQAIENNAYRNKYHPVRNYLEGLTWDGIERIETLFRDYFGCEDNLYTREAALCMFSAAVHRIYEPGFKFDFAVVLGGAQGIGKTTFIRELGLIKWYGELSSFDPKIAMEEITGKWIIEISEMGATNKQELEQQKSFLSACHTRVRMAYAHHAINFKRQCVFIGSTNQCEYLKDSTGNRRWWPINCTVKSIDIIKLKQQLGQIWAEAYILWVQGKSVFLSKAARLIAEDVQEEKREDDEWSGIIDAWLQEEDYIDRYTSRLGSFEGAMEHRDRVCVIEIWEDCLNANRPPKLMDRRRIGNIMDNNPDWKRVTTCRFGKRFGRQRGWKTDVPF